MISYGASPCPTNLSACSCPCPPAKRVIYNPGQPCDQFQAQPHKNSCQQYWGKRGKHGEAGQKYIKGVREEFLKPVWQPKPLVSLCCVIGRTWERIWDSALCSWLTKRKRLAFSYWSRGLYPPGGHGVMSLFINTFVLSQFCLRHQCDVSFTPA